MDQILNYVSDYGIITIGIILILIGFIGSVMPALPGPPIALISLFLIHYTLIEIPVWLLVGTTLLAIVMAVADYFVPILGTKKFGGSKYGVKGSSIGLLVGVLITFFTSGLGIVLLLLGPFIGAFLGEKYAKNDNTVALKSAIGSLVGFLAGTFGKIVVVSIIGATYLLYIVKYMTQI